MTETILLCQPTSEGILTGVYTAYEWKLNPNTTHLQLGEVENYQLFSDYKEIKTDRKKAVKVDRSLRRRFSSYTVESLWYAMASDDEKRGDAVYHTIARGLAGAYTGELMYYLQDPYVNLTAKLRQKVCNEAHHYKGFVRFAELESGVLYSEIEPQNEVLPFLGEHFADRFPGENFIIRDKVRGIYLVHERGREYYLFREQKPQKHPLPYSHKEEQIQELFRRFVHTVSIKERENLKLQQQLLPLRFRSDMIEFMEEQE